ncbi:NAD-dependent epimerase [Prolixibacter bellariivorans]|uniref:NAD-dependent epimerase n=1 Tax=Prolixibacter bellariivorans TaxID=314319 RepID=A0A5M4B423_9BACT|nr:aldehyde reductase [Prolixibacter bellariivorans]GET34427.1 NAD-dependent epimerase [Prolixibacter bellariivorans]
MKTSVQIDSAKPILVTGGSGYVASWIVKQLLDAGYNVRTTVRNKSNTAKYEHLLDIAKESKGKLEVFEADLMKEGTFLEAMKGCELLFHTASPFKIAGFKSAQKELVDPALQGTRNVLLSANITPSLKRIVLTASVATIYGDAIESQNTPNGTFTDRDWNETSSLSHQPYSYSKTVAEKEAWKMEREQDQWELVTVHPGFVLGPSLTPRTDSTSIDFMISFLNGKYKTGVPDFTFGFVDVRDVAKVHVAAGMTPSAKGRYIAVSESKTALEVAQILREKYNGNYPIPTKVVPRPLLYIVGPMMGFKWKFLKRNLGYPIKFDNSPSINHLGIQYIPLKQTIEDHAEQIINEGLLKK